MNIQTETLSKNSRPEIRNAFRPKRSLDEHYSISEAARRLGVARNTLRTRIDRGEIRVTRKSRTLVRVAATEINRWLYGTLPVPQNTPR